MKSFFEFITSFVNLLLLCFDQKQGTLEKHIDTTL